LVIKNLNIQAGLLFYGCQLFKQFKNNRKMALTKEQLLAKFAMKVKFTMVAGSLETREVENTETGQKGDIYIFEVKDKFKASKHGLIDGQQLTVLDNKVHVAADCAEAFLAGLDDEGNFEGPLKWDVSKPKMSIINGKQSITMGPRIWLVKEYFDEAGRKLTTKGRENRANALNTFVASLAKSGGDINSALKATAEATTAPVTQEEEPAEMAGS
jgi:hypothetical protein